MIKTPDVLELTRDLVVMDTINPPGREHECISYLGDLLIDAAFDVEVIEFEHGRSNLIARLGNNSDGLGPICLTGHVDTVPLGAESWSRDPFGGEVGDGKIYGRGTTDMKGGVAALTVAALNLSERVLDSCGMVLIFTGGEETGCDGAKALCKNPEILGRAGAIVVGEPTSNAPMIGHKGALWLNVMSQGVTAHGSTPELGTNAVYSACRAVSKIEDFGFNVNPHEIIGSPSINVGRIKGGININSVPDHAEFDIDIRTIPDQNHEEICSHLESYLGDEVKVNITVDVNGVISDYSSPWIKDVFNGMATLTGEQPNIKTAKYFTDASVLTPAFGGPPTIVLGPGDAEIAHKIDEYCEIDKLYEAVKIYEMMISKWCQLQ